MNDVADKLGTFLNGTEQRDAVHIAIAPVVADTELKPGQHIGFVEKNNFELVGPLSPPSQYPTIGIVDPLLSGVIHKGQRFWMWMYPNTVTSLRHDWEHPSFPKQSIKPMKPSQEEIALATQQLIKDGSIEWMQDWANEHMSLNYYDDGNEHLSKEESYKKAIEAGHTNCVGPYEEAKEYIDNEWWDHWENITGCKGDRGQYIRCGC